MNFWCEKRLYLIVCLYWGHWRPGGWGRGWRGLLLPHNQGLNRILRVTQSINLWLLLTATVESKLAGMLCGTTTPYWTAPLPGNTATQFNDSKEYFCNYFYKSGAINIQIISLKKHVYNIKRIKMKYKLLLQFLYTLTKSHKSQINVQV